jgi:hypothetical protein
LFLVELGVCGADDLDGAEEWHQLIDLEKRVAPRFVAERSIQQI